MNLSLSDLLGVLSVVAYLAGIGAVTVRAVMLRQRQRQEEERVGSATRAPGVALLFAVTAGMYVLLLAMDAPTVWAVLSNRVTDIPPASTARAALFAVWIWTLHTLLYRLARGRLDA